MKLTSTLFLAAVATIFAGCVAGPNGTGDDESDGDQSGDENVDTAQGAICFDCDPGDGAGASGGGGDPDPDPVPSCGFYDGTLVKGSSAAIYQVTSCVRHAFPDMNTFNNLGYQLGSVVAATDAQINAMPLGSPIPVKLFRENALVTAPGYPVYLARADVLHQIPDLTTAGADGGNVDAIAQSGLVGGAAKGSALTSVFPINRDQSAQINGDYHYIMESHIQLTSTGWLNGWSRSTSTYWLKGFTGCAVAMVTDASDTILWRSDIMQLGVDGTAFGGPHTGWWGATVDSYALNHARKVGVYHYYCPQNRFWPDLISGLKAIGEAAGVIAPILATF